MWNGLIFCLLLIASLPQGNTYDTLFRNAASDSAQGKYDQAIAQYKAALALRPGAPEALNNLAVMYYAVHDFANAYKVASGIWREHPELKAAALITGLAAIQINQPRDAIAPLNTLIASDKTNRDALLGLASAHLALGELPQAARIYEQETAYQPDDFKAWYGKAICYERMAESASRRLARIPGGAAYSKRLLGEYLQSAGDEKLAREAFGESAVASGSAAARAEYQTARALADQARNAFERMVTLAPDSWQTEVFLGDVDRQHGNLVSALAHYKKASEAESQNSAALLGMGTAYWELGDFEHASVCLRETLKLNPHAQQALFELGNIAVRRHHDAEAIPLLTLYLASQPDALAAHADLGRAYLHLKQYSEAVPELETASEADESGDIHYQLSVALKQLGRTKDAQLAMEKSKTIREAQLARQRRLEANH